MLQYSETDLRFIVETVVTRRGDHERVIEIVRDKSDLLDPLLEDPRLGARLLNEEEAFARISPRLMFDVLLRQVRRLLGERGFVMEVDDDGKRLPLFRADEVRDLLGERVMREYLVEMLCSFVRTNLAVIYWHDERGWHKRKLSDMDIDDMVTLCHAVEPDFRAPIYKRLGDIALFLSGIFPDHADVCLRRPRSLTRGGRTLADYEAEGKRFYGLAARQPAEPWSADVFEKLAEHFVLARQALNTLSDTYLKPLRSRYFNFVEN